MAGSINKVILVGNVGSDPEIKTTQVGGEIANFSIATSERWKDKASGEMKEKTDWTRVVVFSPGLVNVIKEYVNKGSKLYIEGKLQTREYDDAQGNKRYSTEVVLSQYNSQLVLLDSRRDASAIANNTVKMEQPEAGGAVEIDDEIPF
jgi:single-strand DNA-binding protein